MGPLSSSYLVASSGERLGFIFESMRESFVFMKQWREGIKVLTPAEQVEAYNAILDYALDGVPYTGKNAGIKMLLAMITSQIDQHNKKYADICEKRAEASRSRWSNQKDANATKSMQEDTNATKSTNLHLDNDSDSDIDNDSDNDNVNVGKKHNKEKSEPSSAPKFIFKKALIDNGCNEQLAEDYIALRNRKKAPSTKTAFDGIVRESNKYIESHPGATFSDVVTIMVERNWVGFDAAWVKDIPTAEPEESEYMKAMNAQVRRQREIDAEIEAERQRRMRENK